MRVAWIKAEALKSPLRRSEGILACQSKKQGQGAADSDPGDLIERPGRRADFSRVMMAENRASRGRAGRPATEILGIGLASKIWQEALQRDHCQRKKCPMIRSELVRKLAEAHPHLSPRAVEAAVEAILNQIADSLAQGHRVELRGFGSFAPKIRDSRIGKNPRSGEAVEVDAKQVLAFRASKMLLARLNAKD